MFPFPLHFFYPKSPVTQQWPSCQPFCEKLAFLFFYPAVLLFSSCSESIFFGLFWHLCHCELGSRRCVTPQILARREVLMVVCELLAQGKVIKATEQAVFRGPQPTASAVRSVVPKERLPFSNVVCQHSTTTEINLFQGEWKLRRVARNSQLFTPATFSLNLIGNELFLIFFYNLS